MNISIDSDAKEYLLDRGSTVTVEAAIMSGCFGVTKEPVLFAKKPEDPAGYDLVLVEGIKVYIIKEAVISSAGANIYLAGDTAYKSLEINGLRYEI
ncbi:MAG: hypothetical protein GX767_09190 [Firmicutes bacterium]|nr:hypothetical protein [Bacillota bacterium]